MGVVQLAFDMSFDPLYRWENFYISQSNEAAVTRIRQWPRWTSPVLVLQGPAFCGKTHLAHLWHQESRARFLDLSRISVDDLTQMLHENPFVIVEDVEAIRDEAKLFHLYNMIHEHHGSLLITAQTPPHQWPFQLPDLVSRCRALPVTTIGQPDDDLLRALLIKRFSDVQLRVAPRVLEYLMNHMERSYRAVELISKEINRQSLEHKRGVTVPFVRNVLVI